MPKSLMDIGPWRKGLVEAESPWDIPDNAAQELINFDVMDDGILRCRRGFKLGMDANNWLDPGGAIVNNQPIETGLWGDYETTSGNRYVFASSAGAVNGGKWLYTADPSAGWTEITDVISGGQVYYSSVVYQNQVYVVATTYSGIGFGGGVKFNKSALGTNTLTVSPANLPRGEESYMIKDRMFVISYDESKVYWSKATDPVTWAAPDGGFVLVNPNDGGVGITGCVLFRDILYIFKDTGIYQFTFSSDPALDGYLQKITSEFGGVPATDDTNIYFANSDGVYQLVNGVPQLLSEELNWRPSLGTSVLKRTRDYKLMALPGQLIVIFGGGEEGVCMNTKTGAWSRYYFGTVNTVMRGGRSGAFTRTCRSNGVVYYVAFSYFSASWIYYFREDWKSPNDYLGDKVVRVPRYRLKTKYFTVGERLNWKRFKRAWIDSYIAPPNSAGGANCLLGLNINTGFSNETRTQTNESTPGALSDRWFKVGNIRVLSFAFIVDSSTGASYTPATGTKDTLTTAFPYWFLRKFAADISTREMQAT